VGERPPDSQSDPFGDFLIGIVPGQSLRFSVFDPEEPDSKALFPRGVKVIIRGWDPSGKVIAVSPQLEILPRHFGWVSFDYGDLDIEAETRTGRKQARFKPLFAFTVEGLSPSVQPFLSPGTLLVSSEVVDNNTGRTLVGKYLIHSRLPGELP
ncbi:MAG TPA: hypothetical protein VFU37_11240, partial [Pyrinomonadaceae bacterium]|nr:hypothetical protein [Pyrinomonadaceae bacterium]